MIKRLFLCICLVLAAATARAGDAVEITAELVDHDQLWVMYAPGHPEDIPPETIRNTYLFRIMTPAEYRGEDFFIVCEPPLTQCPFPYNGDEPAMHGIYCFQVSGLAKSDLPDRPGRQAYSGSVALETFKRVKKAKGQERK